tara:strand:- start:1769 stop:2779 length:1011 start_codon:yes stop_codon:yes gene_type:complete
MLLRANSDLFGTIKALAGVNNFTDNEKVMLVSLTERRLSMAYNSSPMWDRYIVVSEKRSISSFSITGITDNDAYNAAYTKYGDYTHTGTSTSDAFVPIDQSDSTNNQNTIIFYKNSSSKWVWGLATYSKTTAGVVTISASTVFATQQDTEEYASPVSVEDWGTLGTRTGNLVITSSNTVPYNETHEVLSSSTTRVLKTAINDFIRIHRKQAFLNDSSTEYNFYADSNGANVMNSTASDAEVFVTYKKNIVDTSTGRILSSTVNLDSGTEIPSEFFNYTAHGVYADFLRMDGQHDKGAFEENQAELFLATELERIDIINNNNSLNHKFSTYINTSSR